MIGLKRALDCPATDTRLLKICCADDELEEIEVQTQREKRERSDSVDDLSEKMSKVFLEQPVQQGALYEMSDRAFVRLFAQNSPLQSLEVALATKVTDWGFCDVLRANPGLDSVTFSMCRNLTDLTLETLGQVSPLLRSAKIQHCLKVTDTGIAALVSSCTQLEELFITSSSHITDDSLALIGNCCKTLRSFSIKACSNITLNGFKALLKGCTMLERIDLSKLRKVDATWLTALVIWRYEQKGACRLAHVNLGGCGPFPLKVLLWLQTRFPGLTVVRDQA